MIYISRLKVKNFKSFKYVDITLPHTFIVFAGPNGSGKSNLQDSVRFALGEISLKSMRAKKTRDLIHLDAKAAEVTLYFDGDQKYEIKRAIRTDGKILYKLNGRKTTRAAIQSTLKIYNLDESGRNIIAQGEVQRIINMGGKERRIIIDSVAGISDFEEKKKEAMKELDIVDQRIKDANLILGERTAYLEDLKKERELAIKYKTARDDLKNAKGSLLTIEVGKLNSESVDVSNLIEKLNFNLNSKKDEILEIEQRLSVIEEKRNEKRKLFESKQKTSSLIRKIEELKALVSSGNQLIEDKTIFLKKVENEYLQLSKELDLASGELKPLEASISDLKNEQKHYESELKNFPVTEEGNINKLRKELEAEEQKLYSVRENIVKLEAEISSKNDMIELKKSAISELSESISTFNDQKTETEILKLKNEADSISTDIENLFQETKECNRRIADIDKEMLDSKEKSSFLRVRVSPALANPALKFVSDLKDSGEVQGIFGLVGELIKFDQEYSNAVESAAGSRLLYVVVDNANTASKVITLLKKQNIGRATFIPISEIQVSGSNIISGSDPLIKYITFNNNVQKAIQFVFSDTMLVPKMADAKKHIGSCRMVTLEGEIFEKSGVISGGRVASNILASMQLKKTEQKLADLKAEKNSLVNRLYQIREEESEKRAIRSKIELNIKSLEIEIQQNIQKRKEHEDLLARKEKILSEISELNNQIKSKHTERDKLNNEFSKLEAQVAVFRSSILETEEKHNEIKEISNKRRTEVTAKVSSMHATIEGRLKELELKKKQTYSTDERLKHLSKERKDLLESVNEMKRKLLDQNDQLSKSEKEMEKYGKDLELLFNELKAFDEQLQEFGKSRGHLNISIEKLTKDLNSSSIKKATLETRLEDLRKEQENYKDLEVDLSLSREELTNLIKESEKILSELGDVNLASIERYEEKKKEVDDVKEKLGKLSEERQAVLNLVSEIEDHKKDAFFKTFYAVSDNFKKMFKYINIGEGFVYLDNPASPFESGLYIKIKRNGRDHTLDSLSGGETSLVALMFIFALQFFKPSPFYILDEVDAALDKQNSKNLALLISEIAKKDTQFIVVSHNDSIMANADAVLGVAKVDGVSKIVGVKLEQFAKGA